MGLVIIFSFASYIWLSALTLAYIPDLQTPIYADGWIGCVMVFAVFILMVDAIVKLLKYKKLMKEFQFFLLRYKRVL